MFLLLIKKTEKVFQIVHQSFSEINELRTEHDRIHTEAHKAALDLTNISSTSKITVTTETTETIHVQVVEKESNQILRWGPRCFRHRIFRLHPFSDSSSRKMIAENRVLETDKTLDLTKHYSHSEEEEGPETVYSTDAPLIESPPPVELPKLISYCFLLTIFLAFSVHSFLARQIRSWDMNFIFLKEIIRKMKVLLCANKFRSMFDKLGLKTSTVVWTRKVSQVYHFYPFSELFLRLIEENRPSVWMILLFKLAKTIISGRILTIWI